MRRASLEFMPLESANSLVEAKSAAPADEAGPPEVQIRHDILRLLLIGPMSTEIGGTTISFSLLIKCLQGRSDVRIMTLDTQGIRSGGPLAPCRFAKLLFSMVRQAPLCDIISLHANVTAIPFVGPPVLAIARVFNRPVVFRMFGGMGYDGLRGLQAWITKFFCRRCDLYLAQTKALVNAASREGIHRVRWFPTSRPVCENAVQAHSASQKCRRFVFVGLLRVEKGLLVLIQAAKGLPKDCVVDVYGPWSGLAKDTFSNSGRVRYCGVIAPAEVTATMKRYDALLLPSFLKDEGYSGVIFEAYSVGIPVIATRWNALPEIVLDGQTGLLVEPMDPASLCAAMLQLVQDDALYARVSKGAAGFGRQFSTESQAERFVSYCRELLMTEPSEVGQGLARNASATRPSGRNQSIGKV